MNVYDEVHKNTPHYIEDTRHKKGDLPPKRKRKKKGRTTLGMICVLMAILCAVGLVADYLVPEGVVNYVVAAFASTPPCVWAVSSGEYPDLGQARGASEVAREMGGAGYVLFDGKYKVLLAAYNSKEDAEKVAAKGAYVLYQLRTQGVEESDFPLSIRSKVRPLVGYHVTLFEELQQWSEQVAQGGTTVAYAKQRIAALREGLANNAKAFLDAATKTGDSTTLNYSANLQGVLGALDNMTQTPDNKFLADLRWTAILVIRINQV